MRDMVQTVKKVLKTRKLNFMGKDLYNYDISVGEIKELMRIAHPDNNEWDDNVFDAVMVAFHYGFILGNRATVAGRIKGKL